MALKIFRGDEDEAAVMPISSDETAVAEVLLEAYLAEVRQDQSIFPGRVVPKEFSAGREILDAPSRLQMVVALSAMVQSARTGGYDDYLQAIACRSLVTALLRKPLPFDDDTLGRLLSVLSGGFSWAIPIGSVLGAVSKHVKRHGLSESVRSRLQALATRIRTDADYAEERKQAERIQAILNGDQESLASIEFTTREPWTTTLQEHIESLVPTDQEQWEKLIQHFALAKSSKPSQKWLKQAKELIGDDCAPFIELSITTLSQIGEPGPAPHFNHGGWAHYGDPTQVHNKHAEVLRGLIWATACVEDEALISVLGHAAEICFTKIPNIGPRSPKIGNACLVALSSMGNVSAVAQLGRLKSRARHASTRTQIARAMERAAARAGMTEADLEEIAVPTFGMTEVGHIRQILGDFEAVVTISGAKKSQLGWIKPDGKAQKTVPSAIKAEYAEDLKSLKKRIKDIDTLMPSIRQRVEHLCMTERQWSLVEFRKRYLDHPLVGVIARKADLEIPVW